MKLVIAEKPQLGSIIAQAIGVVKRQEGYIECKDGYTVTWAIGHILETKKPDEINPDYGKTWSWSQLPMQLRPLQLKPTERTKAQFKIIEKLLKSAHSVVNAGDPDDEGQLLIREILDYTGFKGDVKRLLLNDLNLEAAKKAMQNLKSDKDFDGLYYKALARSQADYLFGMNLSRAYTIAAKQQGSRETYSVGRVKTPTLGLIVRRYLANKHHQESFYYTLSGEFEFAGQPLNAKLILAENIPTEEDEDGKEKKITAESTAQAIQQACQGKPAQVQQCTKEAKSAPAPLPFSLLDLQARINDKYGFSADETLSITQALREKHKAITYNRSDCRYLSSEQFTDAPKTLDFLSTLYPELPCNQANTQQKSRAFNDKKITAHTGIIPVKANFALSDLADKESKVYREIVEQYLIQFLPEKKYDLATVVIECGEYQFKTTATHITDFGWSKLVPDEAEENDDNSKFGQICALSAQIQGICQQIEIKKEKTKPKPIYTESTLLKDMQRVARYVEDPRIRKLLVEKDKGREGENGGIGTPATRSSTIKQLHERGFFDYNGKKLIPTEKGINFINALPRIVTVPDTTGLWFEQQIAIEKGELTVEAFLDGIEQFINEQIDQAKQTKIEVKGAQAAESSGEPCQCGKGQLVLRHSKNGDFFSCTAYPDCKITKAAINGQPAPDCPCCGGKLRTHEKGVFCQSEDCLKLWRTVAGKRLSDAQILALLTKGKTGKMRGLVGKSGKEFTAILTLNKAEKKVEFELVKDEKK